MWAVRILGVVALTVSILCTFSFSYLLRHDAGQDLPLKLMMLAMAIGFGIAGGKPRNWQPWVYFYADSAGLHFPTDCPPKSTTKWLAVPWKNVGEIAEAQLYSQNRSTGVSLALMISSDEIDRFFRNEKLAQSILGGGSSSGPYFTVGYKNSFKDTEEAVRALNSMKEQYS
ncbi:MAG TPA: hypothetical protein VKA13_02870 [Gammaproteobacteria bacterium]|nr:hypothetical protein [Gammaproteobacteria bacterium]